MAKPIKETPVIKGKDAKDFYSNMKASEKSKISAEVRERMNKNFQALSNIAKF